MWPVGFLTYLHKNRYFLKTARNFWAILRPEIEENISFLLNLVNQLDALVGEAGIPRNFDKRKQPYMAIYVYQLTRHAYVCSPISQKRLEIFQQYFVSC